MRDGVRSRLEAVPLRHCRGRQRQEALRLAIAHRPSLMLTDIGMAGMSGIELTEVSTIAAARDHRAVHARQPRVCGQRRARRCAGYVLKHAPADQLVAAIQAVSEERPTSAPSWTKAATAISRHRNNSIGLTPRERFILSGLARGFSNKRLADELQTSVRNGGNAPLQPQAQAQHFRTG